MGKDELKAYFEAHSDESELYVVKNKHHDTQVFMGSQKVHATNFAAGITDNMLIVKKSDVYATEIPTELKVPKAEKKA
jgi:hypothetical protein